MTLEQAIAETRKNMGFEDSMDDPPLINPRREVDEQPLSKLATMGEPECLVGRDALQRQGDSNYHLIWPIREGRLHLLEGWAPEGSTPSAMQADLAQLWTGLIEKHLHISANEFSQYHVMLLVPDQFLRKHVHLMMEVLLEQMGFTAAFLHQESVCAAFGAGLSTACVVDIGHEKVSVSCVDEGVSISRSRVFYNYGGKDIQKLLCHLLCNSPLYHLGDGQGGRLASSVLDGQQGIVTIKESLCHLDYVGARTKVI